MRRTAILGYSKPPAHPLFDARRYPAMPAMNPSPDISRPSQNIQTGTYRNYRKTLEELLASSPPSLALHNRLEGTGCCAPPPQSPRGAARLLEVRPGGFGVRLQGRLPCLGMQSFETITSDIQSQHHFHSKMFSTSHTVASASHLHTRCNALGASALRDAGQRPAPDAS